jgi:hypothetical protein
MAKSAFGHDRHVSAATCGWRQTGEGTAEYKKLSIFLLRLYKRQSTWVSHTRLKIPIEMARPDFWTLTGSSPDTLTYQRVVRHAHAC